MWWRICAFSFAGGNLWAYYAISALVQVGTSIVSAIGVPLLFKLMV